MNENGEWFKRKGSVLTLRDALALSVVMRWAQKNVKLQWINDNNDHMTGTARSIGDENGNFLRADDDVRDGFFRITTSMGFEWFVPLVDVVHMVQATTMVEDL